MLLNETFTVGYGNFTVTFLVLKSWRKLLLSASKNPVIQVAPLKVLHFEMKQGQCTQLTLKAELVGADLEQWVAAEGHTILVNTYIGFEP